MPVKNTRKKILFKGRRGPKLLTHEQVLALDNYVKELTLKMTSELTPGYHEITKCPTCGWVLSKSERLMCYTTDLSNIKTRCYKCKSFYHAYIQLGDCKYVLYAQRHIIFRLRNLWSKTPDEILKLHPAFYHSCVYNYGNITKAFLAAKIKYIYKENQDWQEKVKPFLGKLTDKVIADVVRVDPSVITKLRKTNGDIPKFTRSKILREILKIK